MASNGDSAVDGVSRPPLRSIKAAESRPDTQAPDALETIHSSLPFTSIDSISASSSKVLSSNAGSSSSSSSPNVDWLVARVQQLEEKLAKSLRINDAPDGPKRRQSAPETAEPAEGFVAKSRYFGHSHWIYGVNIVSALFFYCQSVASDP